MFPVWSTTLQLTLVGIGAKVDDVGIHKLSFTDSILIPYVAPS